MYDAIREGKYQTKLTIIPKPVMPKELRLTASQMTGPQLKDLPRIKAEYDAALDASNKSLEAYRLDESRLLQLFEEDCAKACDVENHYNRGRLYGIAWDLGHSSGLGDVWSYYERLSELMK